MELTLYVTDLEVLCVGQRGDVDLCTRVLLDVAHKPPLLPNQPPDQELGQQRKLFQINNYSSNTSSTCCVKTEFSEQ